jgi:putative transposase
MRGIKLTIHVHLVWATWERAPLITATIERDLYRIIESEAREQGCSVIALNGTCDHTHVLVSIPDTISIEDLVKQLKGVSSRWVNQTTRMEDGFQWESTYGAFTISQRDLREIADYVERQKEHHESGHLIPELEQTFEEFEETGYAQAPG